MTIHKEFAEQYEDWLNSFYSLISMNANNVTQTPYFQMLANIETFKGSEPEVPALQGAPLSYFKTLRSRIVNNLFQYINKEFLPVLFKMFNGSYDVNVYMLTLRTIIEIFDQHIFPQLSAFRNSLLSYVEPKQDNKDDVTIQKFLDNISSDLSYVNSGDYNLSILKELINRLQIAAMGLSIYNSSDIFVEDLNILVKHLSNLKYRIHDNKDDIVETIQIFTTKYLSPKQYKSLAGPPNYKFGIGDIVKAPNGRYGKIIKIGKENGNGRHVYLVDLNGVSEPREYLTKELIHEDSA